MVQWPRIRGITNPTHAQITSLESPKLLELREILAQLVIEQQRKLIVFSQWRRMLRLASCAVQGLLPEHGRRQRFESDSDKHTYRE